MTKTLELLFDFASPNVYFAHRALPPILERTRAELVITPCLLGGLLELAGNRAPLEAFAGSRARSLTKCWKSAASSRATA